MGHVVVGIDDSDGARRALQWAANEAQLRGASLEVVHVFDPVPSAWAYADGELISASRAAALEEDIARAREEAHERAGAMAQAAVEGLDGLDVSAEAVEGHRPAEILIERSTNAEMLVVGSRGRGGFAGLLLGSVSQQCATHAKCPVVIIPHGDVDNTDKD